MRGWRLPHHRGDRVGRQRDRRLKSYVAALLVRVVFSERYAAFAFERVAFRACTLRFCIEYGTPTYGEFEDPVAGAGQVVVEVAAAGLNPVDVRKADGTYLTGPPPLPSVAGTEAVGTVAGSGRRVYSARRSRRSGRWRSARSPWRRRCSTCRTDSTTGSPSRWGSPGSRAGSRLHGAPSSSPARRCSCSAQPASSGGSRCRRRSCWALAGSSRPDGTPKGCARSPAWAPTRRFSSMRWTTLPPPSERRPAATSTS